MTFSRILPVLVFAALLGACQTLGGGPTPPAAALLDQQGFRSKPTSEFNKDLTPEDLRTTASYECETPRCSADMFILYAVDPDPITIFNEINDLQGVSPARARRAVAAVFGKETKGQLKVSSVSTFAAADGKKGLTIDANMSESGIVLYVRMTGIYSRDSGRLVIAASDKRAAILQLGSRQMLE